MDYHDMFLSLSSGEVSNFIKQGKEEDLHLDFKTINNSDLSHHDDKKNFAKALSGYANSDGGIIIWGVNARKNKDGINCAYEISEIDNAKLLYTKLIEFTGQFVSPIVEGVEHRLLKTKSMKGFVITYIPASDSGPHMAKAGEDRYYKRSGDSFYKMEHFDIEDMFGRRKKPKLRIMLRFVRGGSTNYGTEIIYDMNMIFGIENIGRGMARYPYLTISVNKPYSFSEYGVDGNGSFGLARLPSKLTSGAYKYGGDVNKIIHPNSILEINSIKGKVSSNDTAVQPDITVDTMILSEGSSAVVERNVIKGSDIRNEVIRIYNSK